MQLEYGSPLFLHCRSIMQIQLKEDATIVPKELKQSHFDLNFGAALRLVLDFVDCCGTSVIPTRVLYFGVLSLHTF
eukprot:g21020.t1